MFFSYNNIIQNVGFGIKKKPKIIGNSNILNFLLGRAKVRDLETLDKMIFQLCSTMIARSAANRFNLSYRADNVGRFPK